jgi:hypothetical protein
VQARAAFSIPCIDGRSLVRVAQVPRGGRPELRRGASTRGC